MCDEKKLEMCKPLIDMSIAFVNGRRAAVAGSKDAVARHGHPRHQLDEPGLRSKPILLRSSHLSTLEHARLRSSIPCSGELCAVSADMLCAAELFDSVEACSLSADMMRRDLSMLFCKGL